MAQTRHLAAGLLTNSFPSRGKLAWIWVTSDSLYARSVPDWDLTRKRRGEVHLSSSQKMRKAFFFSRIMIAHGATRAKFGFCNRMLLECLDQNKH